MLGSDRGCSLIVTCGMNEFHSGHVDVSIKVSQIREMGALMRVEAGDVENDFG